MRHVYGKSSKRAFATDQLPWLYESASTCNSSNLRYSENLYSERSFCKFNHPIELESNTATRSVFSCHRENFRHREKLSCLFLENTCKSAGNRVNQQERISNQMRDIDTRWEECLLRCFRMRKILSRFLRGLLGFLETLKLRTSL